MTKLPEKPHHILGEVAYPCPAFCGFGELGSYVVGMTHSLAFTERAFNLIPMSHGLSHSQPASQGWAVPWETVRAACSSS